MPHDPPPSSSEAGEHLDLLLVGALTVDRFADGSSAAGGAILHGARAAAEAGASVGVVTVAGGEPVARDGIAELERLARRVKACNAPHTIVFRHHEAASGRRLWVEQRGGRVDIDGDAPAELLPHSALFAPVLDELPDAALDLWGGAVRGACLQGWLRCADSGGEVRPIDHLGLLPDETVRRLASFAVLFASHEDLAMLGGAPDVQLVALRRRIGPGPLLILTAGVDGAWFDIDRRDSGLRSRWHLNAPARVVDVLSTGAGDAFAALFLFGYDGMPFRGEINDRALRAMNGVASILERRRS